MRVNAAGGCKADRRVFGGMAGLQLVDMEGAAHGGLRLPRRAEVEDAGEISWARIKTGVQALPARLAGT
jgi:hypothetical protein